MVNRVIIYVKTFSEKKNSQYVVDNSPPLEKRGKGGFER